MGASDYRLIAAMKEFISIGASPPSADCIQAPYKNLLQRDDAYAECYRYIAAIRSVLGKEPQGARFRIQRNPYDFGNQERYCDYYFDVICQYETDNEEAQAYAFRCESDGPDDWPVGYRTQAEFNLMRDLAEEARKEIAAWNLEENT